MADLSATAASNSPQGTDIVGATPDDFIRALSAILREASGTLYTAGGTADALTITTVPAITAYFSGLQLKVKAAATNTGAVTLNVNSLGAKSIVDCFGVALSGGEISASSVLDVVYDGTNFVLLGTMPRFSSGALSGIRNRLINPSGGAVYQRAVAATADDTYFADRWYALTQTDTVTPSVLSDPENGYPKGVRLTQSQASAQRFGFAQIIEGINCKDMRGGSGVLVPRVRISNSQAIRYAILGWTGTEDSVTSDVVLDWTSASYTAGGFFVASNVSVLAVGSQTPSANTWTSLAALTGAMGSTFNNIVVMVWTEGTAAQNFTLDFDHAQLEKGAVATPFEHRPILVENGLCQRYFLVEKESSAFGGFATGYMQSSTKLVSFWFLKVPGGMRVVPTYSSSAASTFFAQFVSGGSFTNQTPSAVTFEQQTKFSSFVNAAVTGGTVGSGALLLRQTGDAYLQADAEL